MDNNFYSMDLTKEEAEMLLAMASENAAKGPHAKTLASLYDKAVTAVEVLSNPKK